MNHHGFSRPQERFHWYSTWSFSASRGSVLCHREGWLDSTGWGQCLWRGSPVSMELWRSLHSRLLCCQSWDGCCKAYGGESPVAICDFVEPKRQLYKEETFSKKEANAKTACIVWSWDRCRVTGNDLFLLYIQGVFFNWCPPKNYKFFSASKFWHLELFWWDLLCNLTLKTFRGAPVKKTPCIFWRIVVNSMFH